MHPNLKSDDVVGIKFTVVETQCSLELTMKMLIYFQFQWFSIGFVN